jgi:hypothetical protein
MTRSGLPTRGLLVAALALTTAGVPLLAAEPPPGADSGGPRQAAVSVTPADRDGVLRAGWRTSSDLAWTTAGDGEGFHLLVAEARTGYTWRTAATLAEPGMEADQWIGNACVTGSGKRAVVVYAPRAFTNRPQLAARGAFTAVVDLTTGAVRKLPITASLAYFNPGCGAGETAALTQEGDDNLPGTRLSVVDAASGALRAPAQTAGQVTSAVPVGSEIVAARGASLVRIDAKGKATVVGTTGDVPFRLQTDASGGISFLERTKAGVSARRLAGGRTSLLAEGAVGTIGLTRGTGGKVFLTGTAASRMPAGTPVTPVAAPADSEVSTEGALAVRHRPTPGPDSPETAPVRAVAGSVMPVSLEATVPARRSAVTFAFRPAVATAGTVTVAPVPGAPKADREPAAALASWTFPGNPAANPVETDAWCSVPRNDHLTLAYQPTPRQVEWAADYAVQNALRLTRPAGFKSFGLPAYSPQGMFPPRTDSAGRVYWVPPQILLGILAQESNLWQASKYAVSGEYSNSLIGNYYGRQISDTNTGNDWEIHWDESDCGYGIGQVTDGMRKASHPKDGEVIKPAVQQRAIALDYAANIAASLQILQDKWIQTSNAGLTINNADPNKPENWFFAAWAYNTGMYPNTFDGSPWGVGWFNNPANPRYPADRPMFLDPFYKNGDPRGGSAQDAAHPERWPYPEKIMGWAAQSIATFDGPGFRPAWWVDAARRTAATPPIHQFCNASNQCSPGASVKPNDPDVANEPPGPCLHKNAAGLYDLKCWYNQSSTWKPNCAQDCGNQVVRFDVDDAQYPEQPDGTHRPPTCNRNGLPANAAVVDDVPAGTPSPRCGAGSTTTGTFRLTFSQVPGRQEFRSKIDWHQMGGGYGGHYWFTHVGQDSQAGAEFKVSAAWEPPTNVRGRTDIYVFLPEDKSRATNAPYTVWTGDGRERVIQVNQRAVANGWYRLGRFDLKAGSSAATSPLVTLHNQPETRTGDAIAFDAVAFVPVG